MRIPTAEARALLRRCQSGALGTWSLAAPGYPFVSLVPYVCDAAARPVFLLSGLAEHTRNLRADGRASLMLADGVGDVLEQARLTVIGEVTETAFSPAQIARHLRYRPDAEGHLSLGDFRFFVLEPRRLRLISGFGRMGWVDGPLQECLALTSEAESELVERLTAQAPPGVHVLGLDPEGLDLRVAGIFRRLPLEPTVGQDGLLHAASKVLSTLESGSPDGAAFLA